ncbi:MAG TPA: class I SAM-dependent methyltransferase [Polyangiaceae bacterium]|jgi:ubiquinone/menaquinone biosynthesis C-methylase UbiE
MGFYQRRILPTFLDKMTNQPKLNELRLEQLASARGRLLEIGFGTGLNAAYYPSEVERVVALDSNPGVERLARKRIAAASVPIEFLLGASERLPFENGAFDTVVTTLVLCSVSDVARALAEVRRVLAPGGRYLVLEHGLADDAKIQKWQKRLNPLNRAMLGGCNLDRPTTELVTAAGFRFDSLREFYADGAPSFAAFTTVGAAAAV